MDPINHPGPGQTLFPVMVRATLALQNPKDLVPWLACLEATEPSDAKLWPDYRLSHGVELAAELRNAVTPILQVLAQQPAGRMLQSGTDFLLLELDAAVASVLEGIGPEGQQRAATWREEATIRLERSHEQESGPKAELWAPFQAKEGAPRLLQVVERHPLNAPPVSGAMRMGAFPTEGNEEEHTGWLYELEEPATCQAFRRIAGALWLDRWRERAKRATERAKRKAIAPALTVDQYRESLAPLEKARRVVGDIENGLQLMIPSSASGPAQQYPLSLPGPALPDVAVAGLRALAEREEWLPVVMERLVLHIARRCWEAFRSGEVDARVLVYPGGWAALTEAAGVNSMYRQHIPEIMAALRSWRGSDGKQPAMVADYWIRKAAPGRSAEVRLLVGEGLVPGYAATLPKGEGRRLLPALPVPELQIPGVSKNRIGALLSYRWELLVKLRESAGSEVGGVTSDGAVSLPDTLRKEAAVRAGLTDQEATAVNQVWIGDGDSAWLRSIDEDRVILVDPAAVALLQNGARLGEGRRAAALARPKRPPA